MGNLELHLTSTYFLELLAAEYLRETNNFYTLFINGYLFNILKKSSKKKEMRIKKEKVEVLQQTIYSRKETIGRVKESKRKVIDRDDEILGFDFVFDG